MSQFKFVGGADRKQPKEIRPEDILMEIEIGGTPVKLVKDQYPNRRTGGVNHVVKIVGIGNPTTFGAEKFMALLQFMDRIGEHFVEVGQLAPAEEGAEG